jgi:putative MATE family efflux protein
VTIASKGFLADQAETIDLRIERLNRTIVALSIPSVAESMLTTLIYMVDTILIGWLDDPVALAAVGLSGTLMWAADGLFRAISISASAIVARSWGGKDFDGARRVAGQSLILSVWVAALLMALLVPVARLFLQLMGGEPEVIRRGTEYVRIILTSSVISYPLTTATSIMRATGDTRKPMYITALMNAFNALSAVVLIFGLGPVPRMELQGAALSTSLARAAGGAMALGLLFSSHTPIGLRIEHLRRWDWRLLWRIMRLALPSIGETIVSRLGFTLYMRILASLGTVALAAHQIALRVESLAFMPGWGLAVAAAALVGQALGAQRVEVAEEAIRRTLVLGGGTMAAIGAAFVAFGPTIVRVFGVRDAALLASAAALVRISALELIGLCSVMVLGGCLRGAGDTRTPMVVTLAGTVLFRVPITYLFALVLKGGLNGVWLATAVDWSMRALIMCALYLRGRWKTVAV